MLRYRPIDVKKDRQVLLVIHCQINYAVETPFFSSMPYEEYWEKWMKSPQPEEFLTRLSETMEDKRTIAEIVEDEHGTIVGYLWVIFEDIKGYDTTVAYVMDIAVVEDFRGKGVGTEMLQHIEEVVRVREAHILRSDTGIENVASQKLHEKLGFKRYHILYEKHLRN